MQAEVVDGVKIVPEPENGDVPSVDVDHLPGAGCEIINPADRGKGALTPYFRAAGVSVVSRFSPPRI